MPLRTGFVLRGVLPRGEVGILVVEAALVHPIGREPPVARLSPAVEAAVEAHLSSECLRLGLGFGSELGLAVLGLGFGFQLGLAVLRRKRHSPTSHMGNTIWVRYSVAHGTAHRAWVEHAQGQLWEGCRASPPGRIV